MQLNLDEQKVAVFGAAHGIVRAIAEAFVAERWRVWTFHRDPQASRLPSDHASVTGDVTFHEEVRAFADGIGDVDHVVFSVGVGSGKFGFPFSNLEPGDLARVLAINLIGTVNVAHTFAPQLITRGKGSMLFLVSVAGQIGSQTDPPYSAAKAGLINFMQSAKNLAPHGIRVNALSLGMVKSPLDRWQTPGQTINIDGGWTAQ